MDGNLTIKGETRPVEARGTFAAPSRTRSAARASASRSRPSSTARTSASTWNNPLPKGGLALANDVRLVVDLQLVKA